MLLTAAAVVVGSAVILSEPIFQGLAIALRAGEVASLALSRMTAPVVYYIVNRRRWKNDDSIGTCGAFVELSSALGYWVHPYWYFFRAFVG